MRSQAAALLVVVAALATAGCSLGPRSVEKNRLRYNEAVKTSTEEQLLLNIVRLRYTDTPSSLAVSSIADQHEVSAGLHATPFFTSAAAGNAFGGYRGVVLPQADLTGTNRPTLTYTPQDDSEFSRRLFTPISLEGMTYLAKTTWPESTVFRLWLENLNWVSNAETASGPTPREAPEFAQFLAGISALQRLHDRKLAVLHAVEREEELSDGVPPNAGTAGAAIEAAKAGFEYRKKGDGWVVVKKKSQPVLRVGAVDAADPDFATFCKAFRLDPTRRTFDLTAEKRDPLLADAPPGGLDTLDLETRSLLQVLFFIAHGVRVPPAHTAAGLAPDTRTPGGEPFDWSAVLDGLFTVHWAEGKHPPACAAVAVCYRGCWFYIDDRDRDTKATFALMVELSRLELGAKAGNAPILTLPLGGR